MARQPLGRGLNALLGEESFPPSEAASLEIDIDLIEPNPQQPRTRFAENSLEELAQSIRANGVVQPIVVRKFGQRYQIVAGERRWRASQKAELRRIPAVIREVSDEKLLELALIENIQRQELNPIEEAKAYRKLIETIGLTQEMVADQVGKERSVVTTSLRLLRLPGEIQRVIEEGGLSAGHGRALLMSDDPNVQRRVAISAIDGGWSVRETEKAVKKMRDGVPQDTANKQVSRNIDANVKAAETKLMRTLNTNVKIHPAKKGNGGKIEIEYYSTDDLDRIYQTILKK
ncbi:MAG: ParB/RepB/Spo0J family partition protein [Pyrinomonadaceae bacterium]